MANIMIDLETLGTGSDTMILTVAAVEFDSRTGKTKSTFYAKIDIDSYKPYTGSFTLDGNTLIWWMTIAPEQARMEAFTGDKHPIRTVIENLQKWLLEKGKVIPWSHGSCFDISILAHHFKTLEIDCPWKFWDIRDTRTLYDIAGVDLKNKQCEEAMGKYPAHHAMGDCLKQIEGIRQSYQNIQGQERRVTVQNSVNSGPSELKRLKRKPT